MFAARHNLVVSPLCAAYLQLLGYRGGGWSSLYNYGAGTGDRDLLCLGAVKLVEARAGGRWVKYGGGFGNGGGKVRSKGDGKGGKGAGKDGNTGESKGGEVKVKVKEEEEEEELGGCVGNESEHWGSATPQTLPPGQTTTERLEWALQRTAEWYDPMTGWKGTSEMRPEDRYWSYVVSASQVGGGRGIT